LREQTLRDENKRELIYEIKQSGCESNKPTENTKPKKIKTRKSAGLKKKKILANH
jgi:hypothetical protein